MGRSRLDAGGNTVVPPFLLADRLGWGTNISNPRFRRLVVAIALLSAGGAFLGGVFFPLLILVLTFGLVGTPFALAFVLYLLSGAVENPPSATANLVSIIPLAVTTVTAGSFLREQVADGLDPTVTFIAAFATVLDAATLALLARLIRETVAGQPALE